VSDCSDNFGDKPLAANVATIDRTPAPSGPPDLNHALVRGGTWQRFRNTFLQLPFLFSWIVRDRDFDDLLAGRKPSGPKAFVRRALEKLLWFWPRIIDARDWSQAGEGHHFAPQNYVTIDIPAQVLLAEIMRYAPDPRTEFLDLGCNSGRHLNALYQAGYRRLAGVDVMRNALETFRTTFPAAAASAKITHDLFQRFLRRQADLSYDLVYSHGATIELVHPSFDIVRHLARIARKHVVLYVHEHGHAYPRMWDYQFRRHGFYMVRAERPAGQFTGAALEGSLLVFQRLEPWRDALS
jgi:SAM-dependent methyltransferase